MPYCKWEKEDWDTLIDAIDQKNCILMLGPDIAVETVEGHPQFLNESLANYLAVEIDVGILKRINASDLAQVSQHYAMAKGRPKLEELVTSFYNQRKDLISDLHRNLAAVPFYFTICTTPDSMFINALEKENKKPIMDWYNFKGENREMVQMGTEETSLVFYLYGAVNEPGSLLLTENDLLDFLVALISKKQPLPVNIRSELQDENKSFLFLGFGFRHWYLRILLHALQGRNKRNRSFAMEQFNMENSPELQHTAFFFQNSDYKIHIFKEDCNSFAVQLREKFDQYPTTVVSRVGGAKAPLVFICHAGEDKDYASSLFKKLEQAGLTPWLDKEKLRGGDEWPKLIEKTIKQIDYFIVLQSKALNEKSVGYVYREINYALDRKKDFRPNTRFIIPVLIEKCPLVEGLEEIHAVDLTNEDNIGELITSIKRDFEKRNKQ